MTFARGAKKNLLDIPHLAIPYLFRAFPRDYMTFSEMEENPALSLPGNFAVACPSSLPPVHTKPFLGFAQPVRTCLPTYNFFSLSGREKRGGACGGETPSSCRNVGQQPLSFPLDPIFPAARHKGGGRKRFPLLPFPFSVRGRRRRAI